MGNSFSYWWIHLWNQLYHKGLKHLYNNDLFFSSKKINKEFIGENEEISDIIDNNIYPCN